MLLLQLLRQLDLRVHMQVINKENREAPSELPENPSISGYNKKGNNRLEN
ncbi:hypothetical protein MTHERMMSTA1_14970 [Methanosarcina thermophila MST-A1]|nr:hypothetical protein MTHERMMSTA1_14970 [Methanosarcina thermophila MST-A1]